MATRQMAVRVDDLDGTVLHEDGRTVKLSLDDKTVELDLSLKNYNTLTEVLEPYLKATGQRNGRRTVAQAPAQRTNKEGLKKIREWASKNGYTISARGRIPYSVMDAYAKSHA